LHAGWASRPDGRASANQADEGLILTEVHHVRFEGNGQMVIKYTTISSINFVTKIFRVGRGEVHKREWGHDWWSPRQPTQPMELNTKSLRRYAHASETCRVAKRVCLCSHGNLGCVIYISSVVFASQCTHNIYNNRNCQC